MALWTQLAVAVALLAASVSATTPVTIRGTCNARCGVIYSNTTCASDPNCEWWALGNQTACQEKCPVLANRAICMKLKHCTWNFGSKACQRVCSTVPAASCANATGCQLSRDGNQCVPACSSLQGRDSCNSFFPSCSYNVSNSTCLPGCGVFASETTCGGAMGCVWLRATTMCVPQCASAASTAATCGFNETYYCSWKNGACAEHCAYRYVSADRCTGSDCDVFTTTAPYTCYDNCSALGYNETGCNLVARCSWDEKTSVCRKNCFEIRDQSTCGSAAHCDWTAELGCVKKCNVGLSVNATEQAYCTLKPWCYYDAVAGQCAIRCRTKYYTAVQSTYVSSCSSDANCVVVGTDTCREACGRLDGNTCRSLDRCFFNYNTSKCEERCDSATSSAACGLRSSCEWEAGRSQCREVCGLFSYNATECIAATAAHCVWLGATSTCATGCQLTSCVGAHCISRNGACLLNCSYLNATQCGVVSRCYWSADSNSCKEACKTAYTTAATCNADSACEYLSGRVECNEKCTRFNSSAVLCTANLHCLYNYNTSTCVSNCAPKFAGGADCNSATGCETVQPANECRIQCKLYNQTGCGALMNCRWNASTAACEQTCASKYMMANATVARLACDADPLCEWRVGTCGQRCLAATTVGNCSATAAECAWVSNATCVTPCGLLGSLASCEATAECQWYDIGSVCRPSCAKLPNASACSTAYPSCAWRVAQRTCASNCETRYAATSRCTSDNLCALSSSQCVNRCNLLDSLQCRASVSCAWYASGGISATTDYNGVCVALCADRSAAECASDDQCYSFNTTLCLPKCSTFSNSFLCEAQQQHPRLGMTCNWNAAVKRCEVSCVLRNWRENNTVGYSGNCSADSGCYWNAGSSTCMRSCASQVVSGSTTAYAINSCYFLCQTPYIYNNATGSLMTCAANCASAGSACATTPGCFVAVGNSNQCALNCSIYGLDMCPFETACAISGNACTPNCVNLFGTNQTGCGTDANCMWDTTTCRMNCSRLAQDVCGVATWAGHCSWNTTSGSCALACSKRTTQSACSVAGCFWASATCYAECAGWSTQSACTSNSASCQWNFDTKACENKCGVKYQRDLTLSNALGNQYLRGNCSADPICMYGVNSGNNSVCLNSCSGRSKTPSNDYCTSFYCQWDTLNSKCVPKCSTRWLNTNAGASSFTGDCLADTTCRMDYSSAFGSGFGNCLNLCNTITAQTPTTCGSACVYDYNQSTCIATCASRVNQSAVASGCKAQPAWECSLYGSTCQESCGTLQVASTATARYCTSASAGCMVNVSSNKCEVGCSNFTSEADCNQTTMCFWSYNYCAARCSALGKAMCGVSSQCMWQPKQQVCRNRCSSYNNYYSWLYMNSCQADANCEWVGWTTTVLTFTYTTGTCAERCYQLEQGACGAQSAYCVWNARSGQCQRACRWKYFTSPSCAADNGCQWMAGACYEKCSVLSAGTCTPQVVAHCVYADAARACTTVCGQRYYNWTGTPEDTYVTDCGNDADCYVGTSATGTPTCLNKCSLFDQRGCAFNSHCTWNDAAGVCMRSCHDRNVASLYVATAGYAAYNTSCAADSQCVLGRRGAGWRCDPLCSMFLTPVACRMPGSPCLWNEATNRCIRQCATRYDTVNTNDCAADTDCRDGCQDRCDTQRTMWGCENVTNCRWTNGTCLAGCRGLSKAGCIATGQRCDWDGLSATCYDECSMLTTEDRCNQLGMNCGWSNWTMMCTKQACSRYLTQDACMSDPTSCDWIVSTSNALTATGFCTSACKNVNNSADCGSLANCVWVSTEARCAVACIRHRLTGDADRSGCPLESHCQWFGRNTYTASPFFPQACKLRCEVRTSAECAADTAVCTWDSTNSVCRTSCNALWATQTDCVADSNCQWFNVSGVGSCQTNCSKFGAANCNAQSPYCVWMDLNSTCRRACEASSYFNESACNNDTQCAWNNATMQCNRKCNTTGVYGTCAGSLNGNQCAWLSPNETARFSVRTTRANVSGLAKTFATVFGVYPANVSVTVEGTGCNTTVATVEVNSTDVLVIGAIVNGANTYSTSPSLAAVDVIEFGEQGSIAATSSAASVAVAAVVAGAALLMM